MLSPSSLAFTATGASNAQTVTVTQGSYGGAFTASGTTCTGIATISTAAAASFSVVPIDPDMYDYVARLFACEFCNENPRKPEEQILRYSIATSTLVEEANGRARSGPVTTTH